jgi:tricorn protease
MCSELAVGHHRSRRRRQPRRGRQPVPGGLLGADYEVENGRYRFRKVFGGLNWNPELRAPLTEPGVDVKAGEYLLAVDGKDLRPREPLRRFERPPAGSSRSRSARTPDGKGSRTVTVVPIESEARCATATGSRGTSAR